MKRTRALPMIFLTLLLSVFLVAPPVAVSQSVDATGTSLTNGDVIQMLKAGLSPEIVAAKIRNSVCAFDTSPKALADLKNASVPDSVVLAMVSAPPPAPSAPISTEEMAHRADVARDREAAKAKCPTCSRVLISNYNPTNKSITDDWLSKNQLEYIKERSAKVAKEKAPLHFLYTKYKENADYVVVWSSAVGTRAYTTYVPLTSTSTTSISGDVNATARTSSTSYQAEQNEHQFVNVVATVYGRDGSKLFESFHQGNWRWSKPDKDCLEEALNFLLPKQ
jgi:hypothetical protein